MFGVLSIYADEANAFGSEEQSLLGELAENVSFGIVTLRARGAHDRMERALLHTQKMEAIGQMAGGIAHDVNNVLQIVEAAARLMERLAGRRPVPRNLDQIHSRCGIPRLLADPAAPGLLAPQHP